MPPPPCGAAAHCFAAALAHLRRCPACASAPLPHALMLRALLPHVLLPRAELPRCPAATRTTASRAAAARTATQPAAATCHADPRAPAARVPPAAATAAIAPAAVAGATIAAATAATAAAATAAQAAATAAAALLPLLPERCCCSVFLGSPLDAYGWVFYDPLTYEFFSSQDVTFDKSVCYYRSRPHRGMSHATPQSSPPQRPVPIASRGAGGAAAEGEGTGAAGAGDASSGGAGGVGVEEASPVEDTLGVFLREIQEALRGLLALRGLEKQVQLQPQRERAEEDSPEQQQAQVPSQHTPEEPEQLRRRDLPDPPPGTNVVSGWWLYKVKRPPGSPPRDYELHSLDFSSAFLQESLHEPIWLRRSPGFTSSFPHGTQWQLRRPVYGLCQAPREWHDTLCSTSAALDFFPSSAEPSLFIRRCSTPFFFLVYVDDLIFATPDRCALASVKEEMQRRHTCIDLGELQHYLGLQITRDRAACTITLTRSHMVEQILTRFRFPFSMVQLTPLAVDHGLTAPPLDESFESSGPYPERVGCLMYLMTCTRPDLAYPHRVLACFVAPGRHRPSHWYATKRVAKYVASTFTLSHHLGRTSSMAWGSTR
ncbi:unnamed protein product [Closterium sp. NIES-53]